MLDHAPPFRHNGIADYTYISGDKDLTSTQLTSDSIQLKLLSTQHCQALFYMPR